MHKLVVEISKTMRGIPLCIKGLHKKIIQLCINGLLNSSKAMVSLLSA